MYSVTITTCNKNFLVRARFLEQEIQDWLNKYRNEDRILYILRERLKEPYDDKMPTMQ
jgi:hypothetical protein